MQKYVRGKLEPGLQSTECVSWSQLLQQLHLGMFIKMFIILFKAMLKIEWFIKTRALVSSRISSKWSFSYIIT